MHGFYHALSLKTERKRPPLIQCYLSTASAKVADAENASSCELYLLIYFRSSWSSLNSLSRIIIELKESNCLMSPTWLIFGSQIYEPKAVWFLSRFRLLFAD